MIGIINTGFGNIRSISNIYFEKNIKIIFSNHKNEFDGLENIISSEIVSGWTKEAQERLSKKVLENVNYFLNEKK